MAYEEVAEKDLPQDANVIGSHVVYKMKAEEDGTMRLEQEFVCTAIKT